MEIKLSFSVSDHIYVRDPESTEVGRKIVKSAINLIEELGFEAFTFKKLAQEINSTEATIYRYFENKHRLLLYLYNWYWCYIEYLIQYQLQNVTNPREVLQCCIEVLCFKFNKGTESHYYDLDKLNLVILTESSKVYLLKEVGQINQFEVYKPYKDLCAKIATFITDYNSAYKYPKSLASTVIEMAHYQQFFVKNLPRLTDSNKTTYPRDYAISFLESMVFGILNKKV
jgi:AcrR family transcriptional regulator